MAKARPRHGIAACDQQFLEALRQIESAGANACYHDDSRSFSPGLAVRLAREAERCYAALRLPPPTAPRTPSAEKPHSGGLIEF